MLPLSMGMDIIDVPRQLPTIANRVFAGRGDAAHSFLKLSAILTAIIITCTAASAQTYSAPGGWNYIVPSGVNTIQVMVAGGGGGGAGAGSFTTSNPGGAGGNGARITAIIRVTPGQVLSGTIGGGGITGFTAGAAGFGFVACTGSGAGGSGVGAGGRGANTNCNGAGASGGGGGGGGGTTFALNGTVLLQAGGGGGGSAWGAGAANAGTTNTTLTTSAICGFSAAGLSSADFAFDGGGGGGGGGGYTAGIAGVSTFDFLPVTSGGGGGNCQNGSSAITAIAITANGGAGADGVPAATTSPGPAGGPGYVTISTAAISVTKTSAATLDPVSTANPKAIPAATMRHCVLITNGWTVNASNVAIVIQIPANEAFISGSTTFGTTCAGAVTTAGATYNAGTLTANAANIAANTNYALVYLANIN